METRISETSEIEDSQVEMEVNGGPSGKKGHTTQTSVEVITPMETPFEFSPAELASLIESRDVELLAEWGGIEGIGKSLQTDLVDGISKDEVLANFPARRKWFGSNVYPEPPAKTFFELLYEALKDTTLIILSVLAIISLIMKMTLGKNKSTDWIDSTAILVAVIIVSLVTALNDWSKEKQFRSLNKVKEDKQIKVIRAAERFTVSVFDLVVGDVVFLDTGDQVPADGLYIDGHNLKTDESVMTGETDTQKKTARTPIMLSGCQVAEGVGTMLVIAIGEHSQWGQTIARLQQDSPETPLQTKLDKLAKTISKVGLGFAIATLGVLIIRWLIQLGIDGQFKNFDPNHLNDIVDYVMVAVTIVVVAVPEGLPLAVTISLAYSMKKMMKDKNLVRHLDACETMGGATNICSDKTGTLTENRMTVVKGWFGGELYDDVENMKGHVSEELLDILNEGVALNSKAHIGVNPSTGLIEFQGNKTECALLQLSKRDLGYDYEKTRHMFEKGKRVLQVYTFSSETKRMSTMVQKDTFCYRLHTKGAAEIVLGICSSVLDENGHTEKITTSMRDELSNVITDMASTGLRTICIAYRDFPHIEDSWLDPNSPPEYDMTCIGIVGIKDPVRKDVNEAVEKCKSAGIMVRMVTGDNVLTAQHIARECKILTEDGISMEGNEFRNLSTEELDRILPKLQVLARSTPQDKLRLVKRLRELGEVVAVTGDGTNDAPALKEADVGLSMGQSGTEVAKEASDIVILDDKFNSIVKSVLWGRSVYENIRKFLQFQLTVNVVALMLTLISSMIPSGKGNIGEGLPLTAIQLLWVNLIMDTFAALALATEPPNQQLMERKPYGRFDRLISSIMLRNIIGQSIFQLIVLVIMVYAGESMLPSGISDKIGTINTMIFNAFVMCQLFNEFNCRKVNNEAHIFELVHKSSMFIFIWLFTLVMQFMIVTFGGTALRTTPLTVVEWFICIAIGLGSIPVGFILRMIEVKPRPPSIPEELMERLDKMAGYSKLERQLSQP